MSRPSLRAADSQRMTSTPCCRDLIAYWEALRGDRLMPARAEFDPRGLERTLHGTFVAGRVAPSVVRFRVAGSAFNDVMGMDVRGMPMSALFEGSARDGLAEACADVFERPAAVTLDLKAKGGWRQPALRARMVLLPMRDGQGAVSRLIGAIDLSEHGTLLAGKFTIKHVAQRVLSAQSAWPASHTSQPRAFAEPAQARFSNGLRLVVDNT